MDKLIKIAVDAMGGDGSPKKIIDGIILNHSTNKNNFFKIFGDKKKIYPLIDGKVPKEYFEKIFLVFFMVMNNTINNFFGRSITTHCINCNFYQFSHKVILNYLFFWVYNLTAFIHTSFKV